MTRLGLVGICCLACCFVACKKGEGDLCEFDDECKRELSCFKHTVLDESRCMTRKAADEMCRGSLYCSTKGECSAGGEKARRICVAASVEDCAKARFCEGAKCELKEGRCLIVVE